jgi:hypothetical protein
MQWEFIPLFATTPHFFPPKEKRVNVKRKKRACQVDFSRHNWNATTQANGRGAPKNLQKNRLTPTDEPASSNHSIYYLKLGFD